MSSVTYTPEIARGSWIPPRLGGWHVMGGLVPQGFDAYARIFHPGHAQYLRWSGEEVTSEGAGKLRWREFASLRGTVAHSVMQWEDIKAGWQDPGWGRDGWQNQDAAPGSLPDDEFVEVLAILSRHTQVPTRCTAGLWDGWGSLADELDWGARSGPHLSLPNRNYLLFDTPLTTFAIADWPAVDKWPSGQTPNLLWPEDRAWFLASDVDFDSTVVGGSRELIDALVACADIEALHLPAGASLAADADAINGRRLPTP
ncbi:MAG: hypothetical protein WBX27_00840 [Specibacter sp.]